jgi:hypothetical protein
MTRKKKIYSIPELRRSFEHIEEYVDSKIHSGETKEHIVKDLKKEWKNVFFKELNTKSAEAFINDRNKSKKKSKKTKKKQKGGAAIAGAPLDYTTRQGMYLPPGQIPVDGHISGAGNFVKYVSNGFWNPEIAQAYDPVQGQTRFPTYAPVGMGSNMAGGKRTLRKKGGFLRIPSSNPSSALQDIIDISRGALPAGPSPDQIQR